MVNHWEEGLYRKKRGSIENNYLLDSKKINTTCRMFDYVDKYVILNKESCVVEFGCNLSRNLREANKRYGCSVVGFDINQEVLDKSKLFFGDKGVFEKVDFRDIEFLSKYDDNSFDLGVTMGVLMHIDKGENKNKLIREILRVCVNVCFFEIYRGEIKTFYGKNGWLVDFDDYSRYDESIILTKVVSKQSKDLKLWVAGEGFKDKR